MSNQDFGNIAQRLARNPLGIIALFIVLVYAIAALLFGLSGEALEAPQRWPFVWFLVLFPLFVLGVFFRLVTHHHTKLYAPQDYRNEELFLRSLTTHQQLPPAPLGISPSSQADSQVVTVVTTSADEAHSIAAKTELESLESLRQQAERQRILQQFDDAIRDATKVLDADPGDAFALRTRAESYRMVGRFENAIRDATKVLDADPDDIFALRTRAEAYRGIRRFDDAIRDATKVLDADPGDAFALRTRAEVYRGIRRFDDAIRDATKVLDANPGDVFALKSRAEAYRGVGQFEDAIRDATKVLDTNSGDTFALNSRASAFASLGRFEEAVRDASASLVLVPDNILALAVLHLAGSDSSRGRP